MHRQTRCDAGSAVPSAGQPELMAGWIPSRARYVRLLDRIDLFATVGDGGINGAQEGQGQDAAGIRRALGAEHGDGSPWGGAETIRSSHKVPAGECLAAKRLVRGSQGRASQKPDRGRVSGRAWIALQLASTICFGHRGKPRPPGLSLFQPTILQSEVHRKRLQARPHLVRADRAHLLGGGVRVPDSQGQRFPLESSLLGTSSRIMHKADRRR